MTTTTTTVQQRVGCRGRVAAWTTLLWCLATTSTVVVFLTEIKCAVAASTSAASIASAAPRQELFGAADGDEERRERQRREDDPEWWRDPLALFEDEEDEDERNNEEANVDTARSDRDEKAAFTDNADASEDGAPITPSDNDDNDDDVEEDSNVDDRLTMEARKRLARHSILADDRVSSSSSDNNNSRRDGSSGSGNQVAVANKSFSTSTLPVLLVLTKLRSAIPFLNSSPVVTLLTSVFGVQYLCKSVLQRNKHEQTPREEVHDDLAETKERVIVGDDDQEGIIKKEEAMEDVAVESSNVPPLSEPNTSTTPLSDNVASEEQSEQSEPESMDEEPSSLSENETTTTTTSERRRGSFGWGWRRRPAVSKLSSEEVEKLRQEAREWKERAETLETEQVRLVTELDEKSSAIDTYRAQIVGLESTMRYLRSQLRDNQQQIRDAVARERKTSEYEMEKVREALVKVLHHERRLMRDHVRRTSAEVKALLEEERTRGCDSTKEESRIKMVKVAVDKEEEEKNAVEENEQQ